ncbi:tRNA guanosine(34) transglycosylase Tgt [Patescibacteria group bacterium]|nr:tRNA guanosine(34) transglycosylase Tgt [Patescibacteria group bacterium]
MKIQNAKFSFKVLKTDSKSSARVGQLSTPHGVINTPCFTPVGTQATVKALSGEDLREIGVELLFGNTYHLHLRPGEDVVKKMGGLSRFMSWNGLTITDSGGFQVFSLAKTDKKRGAGEGEAELVRITEDGVKLHSHIDGSVHYFTPEESIKIQQKLGADLILSFDDCPPHPATHSHVKRAVDRTHRWAKRSLSQHKKTKNEQALYGIVQGGIYKDLRIESAKFISALDFEAIAIGGVAVGESKKEMLKVLDWVVPHLSKSKPRHLLGVGEVDDIFEIIERGIDTFDCVIPTRLGRTGVIFVSPSEGNKKNKFRFDITKAKWVTSKLPLDKNCNCKVCKNYTRGYINHLFRAKELLAYHLASYHNTYFLINLTKKIRQSILENKFEKMKKEWLV